MNRFVLVAGLLLGLCSCSRVSERESDFRMHLRLWPEHHNDTVLRDALVEALDRHEGLFDDVWFCMETSTISMQAHRASAENMGAAAEKFRNIGVEPSVQGISLGHSDTFRLQSSDFNPTGWNAAVGIFGNRCQGIHCPRQKGFLEYIEAAYQVYARSCTPRIVWIDDDLRLTHHEPARSICYCEDCIAEFNRVSGGAWTRESLVAELDKSPDLRREWISFTQQGLAMVAAAIARGVKAGSPSSNVGLQHAGFHRELLEGRDWNMVFDSLQSVTGMVPASRPGHGFYNDHAPRKMIKKAHEIARQVNRLNENISEIACEVEGYRHWASGKSPHGLCVESMLYLAMGATQLSYAIICSGAESMDWYSFNYFTALSAWRKTYEEYVAFNRGTHIGGVDPYLSPEYVLRDSPDYQWITSGDAADFAVETAALGIPYAPESEAATACFIDAPSAEGLSAQEIENLPSGKGLVFDEQAWDVLKKRGLDSLFLPLQEDKGLNDSECYMSVNGNRVVVVPAFTLKVSEAERMYLLRVADWASEGCMPVMMESPAQMVVVPRVFEGGGLRSVMLLNCSISEQMQPTRLRLRGCPREGKLKLTWHTATGHERRLGYDRVGEDVIVEIPPLKGWWTGWLSVE